MGIALLALAMTACDDTTDTIGSSLTDNVDQLKISTDTFKVESRSIIADSVYSRSHIGYLGKVKDPETGAHVTGHFMAQFHTLENYRMPEKDSIVSKENGEVIADSCEIRLIYKTFFGDSLSTMKMTVHEMGRPMEENETYYSNFDPIAKGYMREGGIRKNKVYTLENQNEASAANTKSIRITLNEPYTDKNGKTYKNYGTYIMHKYYENPANFKNSYNFIHNVCPGFYFETKDGIGSMAYIHVSQLNVYFRYTLKDSVYVGTTSLSGTEEVLQTTRISNEKDLIQDLANDNTCTYVKSPAGIFTELTLPVDEITKNHEKDTLNTVKISLTRINNSVQSDYGLDTPLHLLMIPKDSLYSFFEGGHLPDNKIYYVQERDHTTVNNKVSYKNTYTFNNISALISYMTEQKKKGDDNFTSTHPNWNKVVIVPVQMSFSVADNVQIITKVANDMSLTSTKLVGGANNPNGDIKVNVIYSKFNDR